MRQNHKHFKRQRQTDNKEGKYGVDRTAVCVIKGSD